MSGATRVNEGKGRRVTAQYEADLGVISPSGTLPLMGILPIRAIEVRSSSLLGLNICMVTRTRVADRSNPSRTQDLKLVSRDFEGVIIFVSREIYEISESLVPFGRDH